MSYQVDYAWMYHEDVVAAVENALQMMQSMKRLMLVDSEWPLANA